MPRPVTRSIAGQPRDYHCLDNDEQIAFDKQWAQAGSGRYLASQLPEEHFTLRQWFETRMTKEEQDKWLIDVHPHDYFALHMFLYTKDFCFKFAISYTGSHNGGICPTAICRHTGRMQDMPDGNLTFKKLDSNYYRVIRLKYGCHEFVDPRQWLDPTTNPRPMKPPSLRGCRGLFCDNL